MERVSITQPPNMNPVFEAGGRKPASSPYTEYIYCFYGRREVIVEKYFTLCECMCGRRGVRGGDWKGLC